MANVKAWRERIVIPTYEAGEPEKYPMFLENRVYQGSSGVVYPNPVIEHISDEKTDKEWNAVFLENKYVKIMILPELGGRVQMAYDKIRERHFVYYNQVIKPALVGLTGPWISGGIEFNWPQHHRPSTYEPTDSNIEQNEDGSVTVWVNEVERMFRTKGMAGFTLYPDKAYLEIKVNLYNRTPHPQTFLWWANPAVSVNDDYQSVFPPDVNAVFDHGKRDVSEFPIAKGTYYKVDYAPGTDISRYKNIPVPTSYMAITSKYDFVGGYENDTKGGLLHVANHHVSPGKKQWTWGNGEFGQAWDRNLTDEDGPYIELMCGVYTDNQPDFSWLQPYEEKSFKQYFMPYHSVGVVKNATKEAMLNLEVEDEKVLLKIYATAEYPDSSIRVFEGTELLFEETFKLSPATDFNKAVISGRKDLEGLRVEVRDVNGTELVSWVADTSVSENIPEAAKAAKQPEEIDSIEQLYLRGLHLEQYRHATYQAKDYYLEALKREPGDVRNNNAMGLYFLKRGKFDQALAHFETAISTLTSINPNPYDGEPYFNKGLTLKFMGRYEEAYEAFFKACWNAAWQDAGYFNLALIDCERAAYEMALEQVDRSLIKNWHHHKARHLKAVLLRKLGRTDKANEIIDASLAIDQFNFGARFERYFISKNEGDLLELKDLLRNYVHNYIECALDYVHAGLYNEAIDVLLLYIDNRKDVYPVVMYLLGYCFQQLNDNNSAVAYYERAQSMPQDYCFPNRLEELIVLQKAFDTRPEDDKALFYMGNFWYANRQYEEARECWERSIHLNAENAVCNRNLALLYYNKAGMKKEALALMETAFKLDHSSRVLMELDQLYKKENYPVDQRFSLLSENMDLVLDRDDLYLEWVTLHNLKGEFESALQLLSNRIFHPWEGGEGKVTHQYITACVGSAYLYMDKGEFSRAIEYLNAARTYPVNLGEGKLTGVQENDIFFWIGYAYHKLGDQEQANSYWEMAGSGDHDLSPAVFYNDQQPDKVFYQAMALLHKGDREMAESLFDKLISYGLENREKEIKIDYFAVSLPDLLIWDESLEKRNYIHCTYLTGLGYLGKADLVNAERCFSEVLNDDRYHMLAGLKILNLLKK